MIYDAGVTVQRFTYGLGLIALEQNLVGDDAHIVPNPLRSNVKTDIALQENSVLYFHQTRLGNTAYVSYSDGAVASWYAYDEWGKPRTEHTNARHDLNQAGLDGAGQAYTGYMYDTVLEIYYAKARFYDPDTKRFTLKAAIDEHTRLSGENSKFISGWRKRRGQEFNIFFKNDYTGRP